MRHLVRLLFWACSLSLLTGSNCSAQTTTQAAPKSSASPQQQMVRLSFVQGDVKVSTGLNGTPDLDKDWVLAGVNFPVEEGTTLVTEQVPTACLSVIHSQWSLRRNLSEFDF